MWTSPDNVEAVPPTGLAALNRLSPVPLLALGNPDLLVAAAVTTGAEAGRSLPQRLARLREIAQQRAKLAEQHAEAVDEAAKLGITATHMAATTARRLAEKAAAEREAHEQRDADYHARAGGRP
jgi:hypothetical protein